MRGQAAGLLALGAAMVAAGPARAGVDEIHVGVMDHNMCVTNCDNANKERSPNVEFQVSFDSPSYLHWMGSPQPVLMASINTHGDTSFAGGALEWRWQFAEHWALEPSFGLVVHDGAVKNKYPDGPPEALDFSNHHVLFGSRTLFRESVGLTYSTDGPWEVQASFEHLSNGQILGHGRNQGTEELGIRVGYRFGR